MKEIIIKDYKYKLVKNGDNVDIVNVNTNKKLKPYISKVGYPMVTLSSNDNKRKKFYVHRLIAEYFIPKVEGKTFINHKDGNKTNNKLSNLEWVTQSENIKHAYDTNLRDKHNTSKFTDKDLKDILYKYIMFGSDTLTSLSNKINLGITQLSIRLKRITIKLNIYNEYKNKLKENRKI